MGEHEGWAQPSGLLPNGLLPLDADIITQVLDAERWSKAEERTAELIACIQPNQPSEERRNAVADYVQRLIMKCFTCQVFTFGSVPLKTYLPDGDIDLTAFSKNKNLKDTWAQEVCDILEKEKSENAEFCVKEVQYIQAEVKIIKCLVENIVVDISFNQLGGLCTLCFLEEVDHLINHNHLFKRSVILIKAWCYYESHILGAHHGLISTYALETLVLYMFHVFNNSFTGPLEVLYRFLVFFSNFDWDNFCVSLWGPVPIPALPEMTAEPPRRDSGELLLSKLFLDACSTVYAVFPGGQENQTQPFVSKHFNVIDPLRTNNNLGRSVSKGNFFRIRSAFAFGAKRLARLLECPKENLIAEVDQFFVNTWERHGCGPRPDAPSDVWHPRPQNLVPAYNCEKFKNHVSDERKIDNVHHKSKTGSIRASHGLQSSELGSRITEGMPKNGKMFALMSSAYRHIINDNQTCSRISDQDMKNGSIGENGKKPCQMECTNNENGHGRYHFVRTRSSPELTDSSADLLFRRRHNPRIDTGKNQSTFTGIRRKNVVHSKVSTSGHNTQSSNDDTLFLRCNVSRQNLDATADSAPAFDAYHGDDATGVLGTEHLACVSETTEIQQEHQDLVNMMSSSRLHTLNGQAPMSLSLASSHLPLPVSPPVLASVGYAPRHMTGVLPGKIPVVSRPWGSSMQFPQGLVSSAVSRYFPAVAQTSNYEEIVETNDGNLEFMEVNVEETDGFWLERESALSGGFDSDSGNSQMSQSDNKLQPAAGGALSVSSNLGTSFGSVRAQPSIVLEKRGLVEHQLDSFPYQNSDGYDGNSVDQSSSMGFLAGSQASSSRSRPASGNSSDGSSVRSFKSSRDKRDRRVAPALISSTPSQKMMTNLQWVGSDNVSSQADDDGRDWVPPSTMGPELPESRASVAVTSSHLHPHQLTAYDSSQINGTDGMIPIASMILGSSRQRSVETSGILPIAFYPTGPPVPFLTMVPIYNIQTEAGTSDAPVIHFDRDVEMENSGLKNQLGKNFDSSRNADQSEVYFGSNFVKDPSNGLQDKQNKPDILNGDFASHWQNLQYGRFCQNPRHHGQLVCPSPLVVPPVYLQGHFPWDGPGRPIPANFTQLAYGPRIVPVASFQPSTSRASAGIYQHYGDELPRYRAGTGTYLPNPKVSYRDRQYSNTHNNRGSYNFDRTDHGSRDGSWSGSSKMRGSGRNHARSQTDRPSLRADRSTAADMRSDRQWDIYKHDQHYYKSCQVQHGSFSSVNNMPCTSNVVYGMYPLSDITANGPAIPSIVMLYPCDQSVGGYNSQPEPLEFGSLGPSPVSGMSNESHIGDAGSVRAGYEQGLGTSQGSSRSSPDQSSSPRIQKSGTRRNYQLKEEDFPPLSFRNQGVGNGGDVGNSNFNAKESHCQAFLFTHHS